MIFVMTASGQLGGGVVRHLLDRGVAPDQIGAGARSPERLTDLDARGVIVRHADYTDPESLKAAYEGVDTLILIPTKDPVAERIRQHANALEAAIGRGVRRIVFLSIASAGPESHALIAPFVLYAEAATRLSGLEWVILRMNLYIDPLAEWAPDLVRMGRLPYPVRDGRVAYITRDDVARATAGAAMDDGLSGEVLELTGSKAITMSDLAQALTAATGTRIRYETTSDDAYLDMCAHDDVPDFIARVLLSLYHAVEAGEFATVTDHVERLTGSAPESVDAYLSRVLTPPAPEEETSTEPEAEPDADSGPGTATG